MIQNPRKGDFRGLKSEKFLGEACPRTPIEAWAFFVRLGNRSVFILDPRLTLYRLLSSVWSNIFFVIATSTGKANVAPGKSNRSSHHFSGIAQSVWTYSAWIWSNIVCLLSCFMLCVITMMLDENVWSLALAEGKLNLPQKLIMVISRNIFVLSHENDQAAFSKKLHSGDLFLLDVVKK